MPIEGISMLLGNDLANDKLITNPVVVDMTCLLEDADTTLYPSCAVTRAMQKRNNCKTVNSESNEKTLKDSKQNEVNSESNVKTLEDENKNTNSPNFSDLKTRKVFRNHWGSAPLY